MSGNGANGAEAAADTTRRATVAAQYIKDLSFESPNAPMSFADLGAPPEIGIDLNVEARPLQEGQFEVVLHVTARAKRGELVLFLVELSYGAVVLAPPMPASRMGCSIPNNAQIGDFSMGRRLLRLRCGGGRRRAARPCGSCPTPSSESRR